MSRKKIIVAAIVVAGVAALGFILVHRGGDDKTDAVETARAGRLKIVETVTATGRIQPITKVKISADVAGKITLLNVKEGDWVEKGALLVQLERERYRAAMEQTEASSRSTEANSDLARENMVRAEKDYARVKELFDHQLESRAALDQAWATLQVEKARSKSAAEQVEQARALVKQSREELSKTSIYAPMAGTISELNKEVGEIALGSQFQEDVIMVLSDLSGMEALVNVDENDIIRITRGDSAHIEVDALPDRVFHGIVSDIANTAKISGTGTAEQKTEFEVKVAIGDAGTALRPGMTASSEIITAIHDQVLGAPIQCVTVRSLDQLKPKPAGKGDAMAAESAAAPAWVADKDGFVTVVFTVTGGRAHARQVKTGIQSETHIEILEGLQEGDEIVTGSYRAISQTLQNDMPVTVKPAPGK
jgi:HlyD family secretion protein